MLIKKLEELEGNEILSRALLTRDYRIILPEGATLRPDYIKKLKELGIEEVCIVEPKVVDQEEMVILKADIEKHVTSKVQEILERHTYKHNDDLVELSKTADNIISNILEEDEVVEKVFDIKQRSSDLYEHSISVSTLSILTALKMKMSQSSVHDIGVACLLHEIGLRYQTTNYTNVEIESLSEAEASEYRKHPIFGFTTIKNEPWLSNTSKEIILFHHERLDGSGFPLHNREMSEECKIVAVCDAFDELICGIGCKRIKVYEAIEYLKSLKGIQFDKQVVDTFLRFIAAFPIGSKVQTNQGEIAIVVRQNKEFPDRPVLRIIKDKDGNEVKEEMEKDLVKVHNILIEKVLD